MYAVLNLDPWHAHGVAMMSPQWSIDSWLFGCRIATVSLWMPLTPCQDGSSPCSHSGSLATSFHLHTSALAVPGRVYKGLNLGWHVKDVLGAERKLGAHKSHKSLTLVTFDLFQPETYWVCRCHFFGATVVWHELYWTIFQLHVSIFVSTFGMVIKCYIMLSPIESNYSN